MGSGRVEIRHKGLKKAADYSKVDVEDDDDWDRVEKVLKTWMTKRYTDIAVNLQLRFITEVLPPPAGDTPEIGGG